jgi:hypothetical protein
MKTGFTDVMDVVQHHLERKEMKMFKLESVGCWIDESGVTFPANENGDPDYTGTGVPVEECGSNWHNTLDATDFAHVHEIIEYYEIKIPDGETK